MMKIAIVIERVDPALGGAERSIFELAEALRDRGLDVRILAASSGVEAPNITVLVPPALSKRTSPARFEAAVRAHVAQEHYDIVHSVLPYAFADVYQPRGGSYAESILRNAVSYENRAIGALKRLTAFANRRRGYYALAERSLCSGNEGPTVAALSRYVADQFERHYRTPPSRIALITNGVQTDPPVDAKETARLRARIQEKLGGSETAPPLLLLFAAHNFRLKGLGPLLRALALVKSSRRLDRPCRLIVSGSGSQIAYKAKARALGVDEDVLFLGPTPGIQHVLSLCDVAVLPTFYDPSSRFILEALAAGKPVITTRFNGAIDHFTRGRHGEVIDSPEDVPALAVAIAHFGAAANVHRAAEAIAADNLKNTISNRRVAEELCTLYESLLKAHGAPQIG
jgi:UDP-glucose:(heptosyl)LPS alpha-1,3-glucosyltransferase